MWILPSLGRPEKLQEVAQATPDSRIFVYLHRGDERLGDYQKMDWPTGWTINIGKRRGLCEVLNWAVERFPNARNYGLMADDVIPAPSDWQEQLETAAGLDYLAYPDDRVHKVGLCTHHCIGGDLMRAVGWWCAPGLKHSYLDTVWYQIASATQRLRYLPYIDFDHRHPVVDKGSMDETYEIGQSSYDEDREVYMAFQYTGLPEAVERIEMARGDTSL